MEAQEIRYRVNKKVFRQASLYAMFLRNRNTFRVGIAVVLAVAGVAFGLLAWKGKLSGAAPALAFACLFAGVAAARYAFYAASIL